MSFETFDFPSLQFLVLKLKYGCLYSGQETGQQLRLFLVKKSYPHFKRRCTTEQFKLKGNSLLQIQVLNIYVMKNPKRKQNF